MPETIQDQEIIRIPTQIEGAEERDDFIMTAPALEMIKKVQTEKNIPAQYNLRIGAQSGGCSGMNYFLGFDDRLSDCDRTFELDDLKLVVDLKSLFYVMGVTLDFVENEQGSGFVFKNPNNAKVCGCSH